VFPDTGHLRAQLRTGRVRAIGELMQQFAGMRPDDPKLAPYFALAEEFDVPVGVHLSLAPPFVTGINPLYRTSLGRPELIEDVLAKHPKLRVFIAHAGYPRLEEITAVLYMYPNVSVDISAIALPRFTPPGVFHEYLRQLVARGFTNRIMFGSDVQDPAVTRETIDAIEGASFLSLQQKRAIFCENARNYFRLADLRCE
jgi:predicted TIM-barrel fold metal-dependent hydrolase